MIDGESVFGAFQMACFYVIMCCRMCQIITINHKWNIDGVKAELWVSTICANHQGSRSSRLSQNRSANNPSTGEPTNMNNDAGNNQHVCQSLANKLVSIASDNYDHKAAELQAA